MKKNLEGKRVLMTVGPTREYLDTVRYISNASSGTMGLAIAKELAASGAQVFLVCGPGVKPGREFSNSSVTSALQMFEEVKGRFRNCDIFISSAAVSDYRAEKISRKKIHKNKKSWNLKLVRNPDILAFAGQVKKRQFCVGFALEDSSGLRNARRKMKEKNCDLLILNDPQSMESDFIHATLLCADGHERGLGRVTKEKCAKELCQAIIKKI